MINRLFISATLLFCSSLLQAQVATKSESNPSYPVVGKPCPDFFLRNVEYFEKKKVSLKDFRGKPLIVDLFSLGCTSCFASLSKLEEQRKNFKDKIQILMIGQDSKKYHDKLVNTYELFRAKYTLGLSVAYDSAIFKNFRVEGVPHTLWIDKDGIVQAVTVADISQENIENFLTGGKIRSEDVSFDARQAKSAIKFDRTQPFLIDGNGGADDNFMYRSLLSAWKLGMPEAPISSIKYPKNNGVPLQVLGEPVEKLYRLAYFGRTTDWWSSDKDFYGRYRYLPILEVKDKSVFQSDYSSDKNRYSYSQVMPLEKATERNMMETMQRDLKNYFGYEALIETRQTPYLKLIATEKAKTLLKTKGGKPDLGSSNSISGVAITNSTIADLIQQIHYSGSLILKDIVIVDETGIDNNIDISFEAVMTDFDDIRRVLSTMGLDFIEAEKDMKALVIRDGNNLEELNEEDKLMLHVRNNNVSYFEHLLKNRKNIEDLQIKGYSLLCYSIVLGKIDITKFCLANNLNVNDNCHRKPPLISAAKYNNLEAVKLLAERTKNIDIVDDKRQTALISASKYGHREIVEYLLSINADKTVKDFDNKTALDYAVGNNHMDVIPLLKK